MPFAGNDYYHPGPATEADRQAINTFIRTSGIFDGLIDFDRTMRDPAHPDRLAPEYDSGDHLHPSERGYAAMGEAKAQSGRDVPYVLLMHVGSFDAYMMPRLLALYRSMGFRFVTLQEAESDPYYRAAIDLSRPGPTPALAGPPAMPVPVGPPAGLCA
jgi:hypothetical protein